MSGDPCKRREDFVRLLCFFFFWKFFFSKFWKLECFFFCFFFVLLWFRLVLPGLTSGFSSLFFFVAFRRVCEGACSREGLQRSGEWRQSQGENESFFFFWGGGEGLRESFFFFFFSFFFSAFGF